MRYRKSECSRLFRWDNLSSPGFTKRLRWWIRLRFRIITFSTNCSVATSTRSGCCVRRWCGSLAIAADNVKYIGPSLRSEFVTFSNAPKFGVASKSSYDDKKRQTSKKSQTLRLTARTYTANLGIRHSLLLATDLLNCGGGEFLAANTKRDFYEVLGVTRVATDVEIKSAYRKLAMMYHPDRNPNNPDAEDKLMEVTEAYAILAYGKKRALNDDCGHSGVRRR